MGLYEIIERLCDVTNLQADIIRKQAEVIAQADIALNDDELQKMCDTAAAELEIIGGECN